MNNIEVQIWDIEKTTNRVTQITKPVNNDWEFVFNEERNGKSYMFLRDSEEIKVGAGVRVIGLGNVDYEAFHFNTEYDYDFIITEIEREKDSGIVKVMLEDLIVLFDRKVAYVEDANNLVSLVNENLILLKRPHFPTATSIEGRLAYYIAVFFANLDYVESDIHDLDKINPLNIETLLGFNLYGNNFLTSITNKIVPVYRDGGLFNFKTYAVNCEQQEGISLHLSLDNGGLRGTGSVQFYPRKKEEKEPQYIDSSVAEIINAEITENNKLTSRVTIYYEENDDFGGKG